MRSNKRSSVEARWNILLYDTREIGRRDLACNRDLKLEATDNITKANSIIIIIIDNIGRSITHFLILKKTTTQSNVNIVVVVSGKTTRKKRRKTNESYIFSSLEILVTN